ncbi:MAG: hypothetical protein ACHP8B_13825 [Terriglobales bacterium]
MDPTTVLQRLVELTGSLRPSASATLEDLRAARIALAQSLLSDQVAPAARTGRPSGSGQRSVDQLEPALRSELETIVSEAATALGAATAAQPRTAVFRREFPVISSLHPASVPPQLAGMRVARTLGPFLGADRRPYWFDIYPIVVQATIARQPETAPFLSMPVKLSLHPSPTKVKLGPGSIWFRSQLLAATAPAGSWTGLKISNGSVEFSAPPVLSGAHLEIAANTIVTIHIQLDFVPSQSGGSGPGDDARAVAANLPGDVTIVFAQPGAKVLAVSDATLTVYGVTIGLHWAGTPAHFEPALQQILVSLTPSVSSFSPHPAASDIFSISGTAPISTGAWGLPVAAANPAALGQAAGAGTLVLALAPGLSASWRGTDSASVVLNQNWIAAAAGEIILVAPGAANSRLTQEFQLWQENPPSTRRSTIEVVYQKPFLLLYFSVSSNGTVKNTEALLTFGSVAGHIDRPLAADGGRLGPRFTGFALLYEDPAGTHLLVEAFPLPPPPNTVTAPMALALHNALLVMTPPEVLVLLGNVGAGNSMDQGTLALGFALYTLLPTLPDPYAANFYPIPAERGTALAGLSSRLLSTPAAGNPAGLPLLDVVVLWTTPSSPQLSFLMGSLQGLMERISIGQPTPDPSASSSDPVQIEDQQRITALRAMFDEALGITSESLLLLDVSSNADQFGVGFGFERSRDNAVGTQNPFTISNLDLVTAGINVRTFTTPQIQWEPVINLPNPDGPFPSPVAFWDDGGPTLLGSPTVNLVPVAPIPVLNQIVGSYGAGSPAAALFTLPFGMKAVATLPPPAKLGPIPLSRPGLELNRPTFPGENLTGGLQVSVTAARPLIQINNAESPSLPGAAVQLRNLINPAGLSELDLSILGNPVDPIFNGEFAPGGQNPRVPVMRIDLSGYGTSMFSDWVSPDANPPAVVQVRFDVMTGRTAYEIVKVKSILYPWGAVVVRTITIQRVDNAEVLRWDSGWVAATPGVFNLAGITVHPGAVRGMYNIRNIRDTSQVYKGSGGVEMTAVYFDADTQIEDVIVGARNGLVPTAGQFGFVQTLPVGSPLTNDQLAELLTNQGPLGGPVDCVLNVGNSGQQMRVVRVEVGNAPMSGGTAQFAGVARGSVVLPRLGSWSLLQRADSSSEPQNMDPNLGVPLIRQGEASMSGTNTNPYRFAEAVDLWTPDSPSVDYCFVHTSTAARTLFPRPKIESGSTQLTSTVAPLLADSFALLDATGQFPRQDSCVPFPNSNYSLQISGPGLFTLNVAPNPFTVSQPARSLAGSATFGVTLEYADENSNPTQINVGITPSSWSLAMSDICVRMDLDPFSGLMRVAGAMQSSDTTAPSFPTSRLIFDSVMEPVQKIISFLEALGLPNPLTLAISNASQKFKLKAGLQLKLPMTTPIPIPTNTPIGKLALSLKVGFGNSASSRDALLTATSQWFMYMSFSGSLQVAILPPIPVYAGGAIIFKMEGDFPAGKTPAQEKITLQAGVIISVGNKNLIPGVLGLEASVTYGYQLVLVTTPPRSIGVGLMLILNASGNVLGGLVGISFTAEADALLIWQFSPCQLTAQATLDAQVDVTLGWFFDTTVEIQTQYSHAMPCP